MAEIIKPSDINKIWAEGGDVIAPSDVKIATGWEVEVPPRQHFNYIDNKQDQFNAHVNQHGVAVWDAVTEYQAGKSYVQGSDGIIYKSLTLNTNINPVGDGGVNWIRFGDTSDTVRIDVASAATVNLTDSAPNTRHINITGTTTITGFTIAAGKMYFVRFNAALTLTNSASLVTQSGANLKIAPGDTCIIRATADNTVEVLCGRFLDERSVGSGQTWQNVSASRNSGVNYTNTTGRPISVSLYTNSGVLGVKSAVLAVDGQTVARIDRANDVGSSDITIGAVIPSGAVYSTTVTGYTINTDIFWLELR